MTKEGVVKAGFKMSKHGGAKSSKRLARYAMHRADEKGERQTRQMYDRDGTVTRQEAYERVDEAVRQGYKYHYRLIVSMGEGHGGDMQSVTRDTMGMLSDRLGGRLDWVAVDHDDHSQHHHSHVIATTDRKLDNADFAVMRAEVGQSWERHNEPWREQFEDRRADTERMTREGGYER